MEQAERVIFRMEKNPYDLRKAWVVVYERSVLLQKVHIGVNNGQILLVEDYQKGE